MKTLDKNILSLLDIVQKNHLVGRIEKDFYKYNDEPDFFSYLIETKDKSFLDFTDSDSIFRRYVSFDRKKCIVKMLGEITERVCSSRYNKKDLIWDNYRDVSLKAIDPSLFVFFTENEKLNYYKSNKQKIGWVSVNSLENNKKFLAPAQLIYLLYKYRKNEPIINFPISTGTALYSDKENALFTALLEVVERDAFMTRYLIKMKSNLIDDKKIENKNIKNIIKKIKQYNLDVKLIDINLDAPVYSILAIVLDETGIGPAVSIGIKSDINLDHAIIGALEECFQVRPWIRSMMLLQGRVEKLYGKNEKLNRGLLWADKKMIKNINFFLKGNKIVKNNKIYKKQDFYDWAKNKMFFYKDISLPLLEKKFFTIKVISPYFQPLYFDERYPIINHKRLLQFSSNYKINKIPHPFL